MIFKRLGELMEQMERKRAQGWIEGFCSLGAVLDAGACHANDRKKKG